MTTGNQKQNFVWDDFDAKVEVEQQKEAEKGEFPDGDHAWAVKGLRRYPSGVGDGVVVLDISCVASKIDGAISRKWQGTELEIMYFLPKAENSASIFKMNFDRLAKDISTITGKPLADVTRGFFKNFDQWVKEVIGLHFSGTKKTSDSKDKNGKNYVNHYINKPYTLTDDDRAALGADSKKPGPVIPF